MKNNPAKILPGTRFPLNNGGSCTVIEYHSWDRVTVRHDDRFGHEMVVQSSHLRRGVVKNPYNPSVYGFGFVGSGEHLASINRSLTREYKTWISMLQRAYDEKLHKKNPSYKDVTVCEEWRNFQTFAEWMKHQKNAYEKGFQLDKDLTIIGNKVYRPDACSFVPAEINSLTNDCEARRGNLPVGVTYRARDNKYYAQMNINGVMRHIGVYNSADDAFAAYKSRREERIRMLANENKERISLAVYNNLSTWNIEPF